MYKYFRTDQNVQLTFGETEQYLGDLSQSPNVSEVSLDAAVFYLSGTDRT